jgi:hypothetical protein
MLGFLGNMTSAPCCVSLVTQQLKRRRYYGYGVVIYRETSYELVSCVREPVEVVRVFEELLTVINSCVLNFECNKVPS